MKITFATINFNKNFFQKDKNKHKPQEQSIMPPSIHSFISGAAFGFCETFALKVKDDIEFNRAKTLEEARQFAKNNLCITKYDLTNLDCANYINEGLTRYYNSTNDKNIIIKECVINNDMAAGLAVNTALPILMVNEKQINNIDVLIQRETTDKSGVSIFGSEGIQNKLLKTYDLTQKQKQYFINYSKDPNLLSFNEKMGLLSYAKALHNKKIPLCVFKDAIKNPKVKEYLEQNALICSIDDFNALTKQEQMQVAKSIASSGLYKFKVPDGGDFQILNHEIGHKLHTRNIKYTKFDELAQNAYVGDNLAASRVKFMESEPDWLEIFEVSDYATVSAAEFVAETYSFIANGNKFNEKVMNMYKKYGGVMV